MSTMISKFQAGKGRTVGFEMNVAQHRVLPEAGKAVFSFSEAFIPALGFLFCRWRDSVA